MSGKDTFFLAFKGLKSSKKDTYNVKTAFSLGAPADCRHKVQGCNMGGLKARLKSSYT